jgi:POT family proton-dependent oligopeptide transporter
MTEIAAPGPRVRTFFGEPIGLAYLSFTEAWERFSYYGMAALLLLYMTQELLLPGHVEHIAGFAGFRSGLESVFGSMSTLALASLIAGLYKGFVYFTPVFGGWIADRGLGRRRAVILGAAMMSAGHLAMAFDVSFLLALLLLIVGCGFLKGNISAQVGALYPETDTTGRTRAYSIYSMGINVGATAGPLLCGLLAQLYGWHAGFGLAGILMLLGLITYAAGYRTLTETTPAANKTQPNAKLGPNDWRVIGALLAVMALTIFHSISYYQNTNMNFVWINQYVDLKLGSFVFPVAWFGSIDSFVSIISVPVLIALWARQAKSKGGEPNEIIKIATGAAMASAANLLLVFASLSGGHVSVLYPVIYNIILGVAFLFYWPPLLALVSRAAPPSLKSTLMGVAFLTLFLSNVTIGRIGALYETMTPAAFWGLHATIAALGAALATVLAKPLMRLLDSRISR